MVKGDFDIEKEIERTKTSEKKEKQILQQVDDRLKKEKTMKLSVKEGSAASVAGGLGERYITPYALALNANNMHIGFLSSFVGLISPLSQLFGSKLIEKYSRKKIITLFVFLQALMWLPILILSLFFQKNIFISFLPVILIVFYSIYAIFGAIAGPSWFSFMGDIVPEKIRGKYFGRRNRITGIVSLISMIVGALILDFYKTKGLILIGFSILFFLAFVFRSISSYTFKKHYEPKLKLEDGYYFSIIQFIKKAPKNNFGKFVIYVSLINFASAIASPFFSVYMLKDLNFSYSTFMIVNISSSLASLIFFPIFGKFSDKYGNRNLLKFGSFLIPLVPILWIFSKSPIYLALIPEVISGVGWAAFNLAASNFIYDSVTPQRRALCVSYFNIFNGIGVFFGATLGGVLAQFLTTGFMNKFLFVFLISGFLRFLFVIIMLPFLKEARKIEVHKRSPFIYIKDLIPMKGVFEFIGGIFGTSIRFRKKSAKKK